MDPTLLPAGEISILDDSQPLPRSAKSLLRKFDVRPRKRWGQNFLVSEGVLERIVAAAEIRREDVVLEVGAGLGTLTRALALRSDRVIALELDSRLIRVLHQVLAPYPHVEILQGDVLAIEPGDLISVPYKVVGNLPYYITSAILRHLLEARRKPTLLVVTVQREVAQRLTAGPGDMSLLAVSVQFYGQPRVVTQVRPGAFYPSPRVKSAVVRIDLHEEPPAPVDDTEKFFDVVRAGFAQRRKQLRNSLSQGLNLPVEAISAALGLCGLDQRERAQGLSVEQWGQLYRELHDLIR
jgi:16S rRNA (adenine1518-N6/adenine1519-N6)-dimethyltransferase